MNMQWKILGINLLYGYQFETGVAFVIQTCRKRYFKPLKRLAVHGYLEIHIWAQRVIANRNNPFIPWQALKVWNNRTETGRQLCIELRKLQNRNPPSEDKKGNYWKWPQFQTQKIRTHYKCSVFG